MRRPRPPLLDLTSDMEVASAHLKIRPGVSPAEVLSNARSVLAEEFSVHHATLQIEEATTECRECEWQAAGQRG